jgi:hypothetical protein
MALPGKIAVPKNGRQHLYKASPKAGVRLYRVTNTGAGALGITYTNDAGDAGRSAQIGAGQSMDFLASELEARDDSGQGANGTYEAV